MRPALTPTLALDYVRELSADVRAGVVLDADGALLAGPAALAAPARALAAAAGGAAEVEAVTAHGVVCAVRSSRHVVVAVCGRFALPAVTRGDLRVALAALEGTPPAPAAEPLPAAAEMLLSAAAEALISAVQRHSKA
jgi:hypothetical protein